MTSSHLNVVLQRTWLILHAAPDPHSDAKHGNHYIISKVYSFNTLLEHPDTQVSLYMSHQSKNNLDPSPGAVCFSSTVTLKPRAVEIRRGERRRVNFMMKICDDDELENVEAY